MAPPRGRLLDLSDTAFSTLLSSLLVLGLLFVYAALMTAMALLRAEPGRK